MNRGFPSLRRIGWLAAGLLAVAVAVAVLWQWPAPAPESEPGEPFAKRAPVQHPLASPRSGLGPDVPELLPLQHGPIAARLPELRALAEKGHAEAACRLALELNYCRALAVRGIVSQGLEQLLRERSVELRGAREEARLIDSIAAAREQGETFAAHCHGVSPLAENDAVDLFQKAALRGSVRQRVVAALLQPDGSLPRLPREAVSSLPLDPWVASTATQFYADHALAFLAEGYRARDPLALEGLILVHAPDLLHIEAPSDVMFRLPDPQRFAGYALVAERVYGAGMLGSQVNALLQRVLDAMDTAERQHLQQAVDREVQFWLATRNPLQEPPALARLESLDALCR